MNMKTTVLYLACQISLVALLSAAAAAVAEEEWSEWSECSRTCDGGAAYQFRKCGKDEICEGGDTDIRYRACNTQACPPQSRDFRSLQCSAYDDVTYGGIFYTWRPHYDAADSSRDTSQKSRDTTKRSRGTSKQSRDPHDRRCALRCEAEGRKDLVVTLAPKVLDGTRCDQHSNDMCINGRCWRIGCDHVLGSGKTEDECGVCGGDGSSCRSRPLDPANSGPSMPSKVGNSQDPGPVSWDFNVLAADQPVFDYRMEDNEEEEEYDEEEEWEEDEEEDRKEAEEIKGAYFWQETAFSDCSVTCGIGEQRSAIVCYDSEGMKVVKDLFCSAHTKPAHRARTCIMVSCGPRWITGEWAECSRSCGGGVSRRPFYCVEERTNASFQRLNDKRCTDAKPEHERKCNEIDCPRWYAGEWSPCSATCGNGHQLRAVVCRRTKQHNCAPVDKPHVIRRCKTGVTCMGQKAPNASEERADKKKEEKEKKKEEEEEHSGVEPEDNKDGGMRQGGFEGGISIEEVPIENRRPIIASGPPPTLRVETDDRDSLLRPQGSSAEDQGEARRSDSQYTDYESFLREVSNNINRGMKRQFWDRDDADYRGWDIEEAEGGDRGGEEVLDVGDDGDGAVGVVELSTTPSFIASPWGRCSATCGDGRRYRIVTCKVFLEFSQEVQTVEDKECTGDKPMEVEYCTNQDCAPLIITSEGGNKPIEVEKEPYVPRTDLEGGTDAQINGGDGVGGSEGELQRTYNYAWQFTGYGSCSAACMGGIEKPQFRCMRMSDYAEVTDYFCARLPLPGVSARNCNDIPCPPRWRTYPFGSCSHSCGGGVRRRQVECIQELGKGDANVARRPATLCAGPAPTQSMPCNLNDCPPAWKEGEWSQCSVSCGTGVQSRDIVCKQRIVRGMRGDLETRPDSVCDSVGKPLTVRPCVLPTCPPTTSQDIVIVTDPSTYIQLRPKNKLMLGVGGEAVVIPKTKVAVRCPVVKFNQRQVKWSHLDQEIAKKGRVKVSRNGVLRINKIRSEDAGKYTCHAGVHTANMTLSIHSSEAAMRQVEERRRYILANHKFITLVRDKVKQRKQRIRHPEEYTLPLVLRDFNASSVPFAWVAGPWGQCSQSCGGGAGLQSRPITCELALDDYSLVTRDVAYCTALSPTRPLETRDCGYHSCPEWGAGEWGACTDEVCVGPGEGARKRALHCISPNNGSSLPLEACDPNHRPSHRLQCPQPSCQPAWKTSQWTDCSVSCGGEGIITRALQCVWVPNKLPAHRLCRRIPRPAVMKPCTAPACSETVCRDESKYCSLVPKMNLCRLDEYRRKCCVSCMLQLHHMRLLQ